MLEQIGPLDEGFFMYWQDVDWCHRARAAGWRVVTLPGVTIRHNLGTNTAQVPGAERARWAAESRVPFYRKHYSRWRARWLRLRMAGACLLGVAWTLAASIFGKRERIGERWAKLGPVLRSIGVEQEQELALRLS